MLATPLFSKAPPPNNTNKNKLSGIPINCQAWGQVLHYNISLESACSVLRPRCPAAGYREFIKGSK